MAEWWESLSDKQYNDWKANQFADEWQRKINKLALGDDAEGEELPEATGAFGSIRDRLGSVLSGQPVPPDPNSPLFAQSPSQPTPAASSQGSSLSPAMSRPIAAPSPQVTGVQPGAAQAMGSSIEGLRSLGIDPAVIAKLEALVGGPRAPAPQAPPRIAPGAAGGAAMAPSPLVGQHNQVLNTVTARPRPNLAQLAAGAGPGGAFRRARKRLGGLLGDAKDKAGDALDWYESNIHEPVAGANTVFGTRVQNFADDLTAGIPDLKIGGLTLAKRVESPYQIEGDTFVNRASGERTAFDPDDLGSYGAVARAAKEDMSGVERFGYEVGTDPLTYFGGIGSTVGKVPGLAKAGRGITAVERLPGKAVDKALSGAGRATKAVLPEVLTRPSVGERSRQAGERAFEQYRLSGADLDEAAKAYDTDFAKARQGIETEIRVARNAAKAKGGLSGVRAGVQDRISDAYSKGVDVAGVKINPSAINRNLAVAALNNPQYIGGSIAEDSIRALLGGGSGRRMDVPDFVAALQGVPGVPSELMRSGRTAAMTGTTKSTGSKLGDLLGGRKAVQVTEAATDPARRGYLLDIHEQGVKKGLAPDEAMKEAATRYRKEFPTPAGETNLDVSAKALLPFWSYQKQRWPYLARKGAEFPGLAETGREFYDQTDGGYLPLDLPLGMQIAPLRGSVAAAFPGLTRDHPPFARGISGDIEEAQSLMAKGGFYPGSVAQLAVQGIHALEGQPASLGEVIPQTALAPLVGLEALGAGTDLPLIDPIAGAAGRFRDAVAGDRFRNYQVSKELAVMGVEPESATPEQKAEASQRAAARELLMVESGNLRYRPQQEQQFKKDRIEAAIQAGVPADVIEQSKRNPLSATDPVTNMPFLNAAEKRAIYESHPGWERWQQVSNPLRHPEDRAQSAEVRQYQDAVTAIDRKAEEELRLLAQGVQAGLVSGKDFRDRRSSINAWAAASRQQALDDRPGAQASFDPVQRQQFYERTGREMPGDLPEDAAARKYFEIQPEVNPQTGLMDFESWRAQREAVLAGLDPATRSYVENDYRKRRYSDPLVLRMEEEYEGIQATADEYFRLPKYLGLSEEDAQAVDAAQREVSVLMQMDPRLDSRRAQRMVLQTRPDLAVGLHLMRLASRLRNPEREQYIDEHPALRWYLSDLADPRLGPAVGAAGGGSVARPANPPRPQPAQPSWQQALSGILTRGGA